MITALLFSTFFGYAKLDQQVFIKPEHRHLANPAPITRASRKHQALIAVADTGVDYNHPEIVDSISEELGIDFVGQDHFPFPFLVRTSLYDYPGNREIASHWGMTVLKMAISYESEIGKWGHPMRHMAQENQYGVWHGTHVAGLASYDQPEIGIVPYRVFPIDNDLYFNPIREVYNRMVKVYEDAHRRGIRIINFSAGSDVRKNEISAELYADHLQLKHEFEALFGRYPDILMVVASGNMRTGDKKSELDVHNHFTLPCMVDSPNVLCVGAVDAYNEIADFTLIPPARVIYAFGKNVLSLRPESYCDKLGGLESLEEREVHNYFDYYLKDVISTCSEKESYRLSSGTSMATPLVAREAAKILLRSPSLSPGEVIEALFERSDSFFSRGRTIQVLRKEKPAWYNLFDHIDISGRDLH